MSEELPRDLLHPKEGLLGFEDARQVWMQLYYGWPIGKPRTDDRRRWNRAYHAAAKDIEALLMLRRWMFDKTTGERREISEGEYKAKRASAPPTVRAPMPIGLGKPGWGFESERPLRRTTERDIGITTERCINVAALEVLCRQHGIPSPWEPVASEPEAQARTPGKRADPTTQRAYWRAKEIMEKQSNPNKAAAIRQAAEEAHPVNETKQGQLIGTLTKYLKPSGAPDWAKGGRIKNK